MKGHDTAADLATFRALADLLAEVIALRETVARVRAVADWCALKEADSHGCHEQYDEGSRDAYDGTESRLRAALDASAIGSTS